jgi:D-alanyl-D-alanine carboxypeptidase (penicillin-binding protein 5/6)
MAAAAPTSTPPPTPVPPFGSPSPFPTSLATPRPSTNPPRLAASSAILEDLDTGQVLFALRPGDRRPIASITKIMTALLAIESLPPSRLVDVGSDAAETPGSSLGLEVGERISALDLLYALLLQSSNDAAVALADAVSGSTPAFVRLMNARAADLGLTDTHFASPNGLDDRGYSSASDLALLTRTAYQSALFGRVVDTKTRDIPAPSGPPRHIQNRNALLWLYSGAIGVKTGFTSAAGNCLIATAARESGRMLAVVLGEPDDAFDDAATLLNYGLLEFERNVVAHAGDAVGSVTVSGEDVPAVAQLDLAPLVRLDLLSSVDRELRPLPGLTLPIAIGSVIGSLVATASGHVIASVPVVAGSTVAVPTPSPSPTPVEPRGDVTLRDIVLLLVALLRALVGPSL